MDRAELGRGRQLAWVARWLTTERPSAGMEAFESWSPRHRVMRRRACRDGRLEGESCLRPCTRSPSRPSRLGPARFRHRRRTWGKHRSGDYFPVGANYLAPFSQQHQDWARFAASAALLTIWTVGGNVERAASMACGSKAWTRTPSSTSALMGSSAGASRTSSAPVR